MAQLDDLLKSYQGYDERETGTILQLKQFLHSTSNAYDRSNLVAHVVADAWIVNQSRTEVVMVEHLLGNVWCSAGGHCDGDSDVRATAIRETEEETGLTNLKPLLGGNLFDVDTSLVPARGKSTGYEPAHLHFDACFAFEAPDNAPLRISHESTRLEWVPLATIFNLNLWPNSHRRIAKTIAGTLDR